MGYRVRHMGAEFYEHACDYCTEGDRLPMRVLTNADRTLRIDRDRLRTCTLTVAQLVEAAHVLGFDLVFTAEPIAAPGPTLVAVEPRNPSGSTLDHETSW